MIKDRKGKSKKDTSICCAFMNCEYYPWDGYSGGVWGSNPEPSRAEWSCQKKTCGEEDNHISGTTQDRKRKPTRPRMKRKVRTRWVSRLKRLIGPTCRVTLHGKQKPNARVSQYRHMHPCPRDLISLNQTQTDADTDTDTALPSLSLSLCAAKEPPSYVFSKTPKPVRVILCKSHFMQKDIRRQNPSKPKLATVQT